MDKVKSNSPFESVIGFSRATRTGNIVAIAGTAAIGDDGKTVGVNDPLEQTRRCFEIIKNALAEFNLGLDAVFRSRVFFINRDDWNEIAKGHGEVFSEIKPASSFLIVDGFIDPEWLVEIEVDAWIN